MDNNNNLQQESMLRVGTILRGIYRIDSYLSSGGFGNTYVATNIEFNERYAIKEFFMKGVTQRDSDSSTVSISNSINQDSFLQQKEKFKKEARRLRQLNNPHIVKVHDLFEENGTAYYVMDYVDGENLNTRLKRTGKPMSEEEVSKILPQILDALQTVHDAGIWHLDLKPANIMVDKAGNVKLIDFGASKQLNAQKGGATTSTAISYTNGFAPREQMEQNYDKFGPWTDLYALGATLYNLLTNKRPPLPTDIDDDMSEDKHLTLPMTNVSKNMKRLILWMMKTNKIQRPQTVQVVKVFNLEEEPKENTRDSVENDTEDDETIIEVNKKEVEPPSKQSSSDEVSEELSSQSSNKNNKIWIWVLLLIGLIIGLIILFGKYNPFHDNSASNSRRDSIIQNMVNNMVFVEGGTFMMGATSEQGDDALENEFPAHIVTLSSFYIGKYEVTQEEWEAVMGNNPSIFNIGQNLPVERVTWNECQTFIRRLNALANLSHPFRLPTEAEWEYAARGGNKSRGFKYSGSNNSNEVAWFQDNSSNKLHDVGTKTPNELGLYDMSGNVWEWCQDSFGKYNASWQTNPTSECDSSDHVYRGGNWLNSDFSCRVSYRYGTYPSCEDLNGGLRLAQ